MTHCNHHHHATTEEHIVCEVANNPALLAGTLFVFTTIVGVIQAQGIAVITNHPGKVAALAAAASAYLYFSNQPKNENSKAQQDDSNYDFVDPDFKELNMEDNTINNHDELIN